MRSPTAITPSPGFISIAVRDVARSAAFYETYLGAIRDTFDFGPTAASFVGWPTFAINAARAAVPERSPIQLWWRASNAEALYERAAADGIVVLQEPVDGPFGRTFAMADPPRERPGTRARVRTPTLPIHGPGLPEARARRPGTVGRLTLRAHGLIGRRPSTTTRRTWCAR